MLRSASALLLLLLLTACRPNAPVETTPAASVSDTAVLASAGDTLRRAAALLEPDAPVDDTLRIRAVGDVMLGTNFPSERYLPPNDGAEMLGGVADVLRDADLTFANLEGPLTDATGNSGKCRAGSTTCYAFRTPTRYARYLADAGIDLASLANNHAQDFGEAGRSATVRAIEPYGIRWSGRAGTFASLTAKGRRVAMIAYHVADHSNYLNDIPGAARTVARLAQDHDIVIVSFHGGAEGGAVRVPYGPELFLGENRGDLRRFAKAVVDAGADLVIGHGPHVPRGVQVYQGRLIAYSLGNFATYGRFNLDDARGYAPILDVELAPDGAFVSGRILSAKQIGDGIPVMDERGAAARLMARLSAQDFADSEATMDEDGTIRLR
ncbi:MAG: CapA family protein [Bacteroidetes bacterium]|nr:CapA family protein [Bacteroidota bacterium]